MAPRKPEQLPLPIKGRGGWRPGAGRPKKKHAGVSHLRREAFPTRYPLHVTLKIRKDVGDLRTDHRFHRIRRAFFHGGNRHGIRLIHFSVQGDHVHLILEARDRTALSRGVQGLAIRLAKGINRLSQRRGKVFNDRYHAHILKSPAEVRNAVHYVLHNRQKHQKRAGIQPHPWYIDPFSSASGEACWFVQDEFSAMIIHRPHTWLLRHAPG
jgi:putative transposase